ncbi:hypothetical protein BDW75DRAFT_242038 [Aspergillus navahoensis]
MGFDCTNYQHQFRDAVGVGHPPFPAEQHIYQTIFLDKTRQDLWMWNSIDENKIIGKKWWHQFGHRWQHYARVVPEMMFVNSVKNRTLFAGAWMMGVCRPHPSFLCLPGFLLDRYLNVNSGAA